MIIIGPGHQRTNQTPRPIGRDGRLKLGLPKNFYTIEGQRIGIKEASVAPVFGRSWQGLQKAGLGREHPVLADLLEIELTPQRRSTAEAKNVHALAGANGEHVGTFEPKGRQGPALRGHLGARLVRTGCEITDHLQQTFHARRLDRVMDRRPQEPPRVGPLQADGHIGSEDFDRDHLTRV